MTLISYSDWYEAGATRTQLERALAQGTMRRLRRGVLTDAPESERAAEAHLLRVKAAAIYLGDASCFSHFSAAAIHGLPLLSRRLTEVTVVRTGGGHGSVHPTIHARSATLGSGDAAVVNGLPTTSLARTLADLARILPFEESVMLLDAGLRRGADRGELLARTGTGRGCRVAERAITFADSDSESPGESLSRVRMHQAGLVMPELQMVITDSLGNFVGRSDFYWEHVHTVGEFDGEVKYRELAAGPGGVSGVVMDEKRREQRLRSVVDDVIRWTWSELWDGTLARRLAPVVGYESPNAPVPVKRHRPC